MNFSVKYLLFIWAVLPFDSIAQSNSEINDLILEFDKTKIQFSFQENVKRLNNILETSKRQNNNQCQANCYRRLGILYRSNGNLEEAIDLYIKAAQHSDSAEDRLSSASNYNQLGVIYYSLMCYRPALFYFKKAYNQYSILSDHRGISDAGANISETYVRLGESDSALSFGHEGLANRKKWKDTSLIGRNYYSLGISYYSFKRYDSALFYYSTAIARFVSANKTNESGYSLEGIGTLFLNRKQYDNAIDYSHKAYDTAEKYKNVSLIMESAGTLSLAYEAKGDIYNAFKYLQIEKKINDSLLNVSIGVAVVDAERKYDSEMLRGENERKSLELKNSRQLIVIIAIVLISVVLLSVLIIRNNINKKRLAQKDAELQRGRVDELLQQQEVESVNAMLKGQDAERKRIAQELHDRLGSILATVKLHFSNVEEGINILKQQQTQSYNEANDLLDEACEEVRRISHDLYEGSLAKFGFRTALLQLISAIEKTNALKITFLDNNVPEDIYKVFERDLYRITQELLSNTLKYASARQVTIQLTQQPGNFVYTYEDDGKGFNPSQLQAADGIGYKNIETRAKYMGGTWHVDSSPGHGMTLVIEIPLNHGNH